jgi:hypothetical protein
VALTIVLKQILSRFLWLETSGTVHSRWPAKLALLNKSVAPMPILMAVSKFSVISRVLHRMGPSERALSLHHSVLSCNARLRWSSTQARGALVCNLVIL